MSGADEAQGRVGRSPLTAVVAALGVACCLAGPALAGAFGGAALWGAGLPAAIAVAVGYAGVCYAVARVVRRRRRAS